MPRYNNIEFRWVNSEEETLLAGQVLLRVGEICPEMVLDIKGAADGGPYLLVGKQPRRKSFFVAENSANGRVNDVRASWAEIGDGYAGRWIEDGYEYLFTFSAGLGGLAEFLLTVRLGMPKLPTYLTGGGPA